MCFEKLLCKWEQWDARCVLLCWKAGKYIHSNNNYILKLLYPSIPQQRIGNVLENPQNDLTDI